MHETHILWFLRVNRALKYTNNHISTLENEDADADNII
jgi:hypothetical protein